MQTSPGRFLVAAILLIAASIGPAALGNPVTPEVPPQLTQSDADAWLDGFMPYTLQSNDIAGAAVIIVKDGQVLTQRGFGYADIAARKRVDPAATMFRAGSISKLFTWTAVMQLVEQHKVDLDADVNQYLDFKIPPYDGKPITMRNLMTHRPGFEEAFKGGIRFSGAVPPLEQVLKEMLPARVYAPGSTPAYSNYGAGLASYIVQRVSGIPFEEYVERNIFVPLNMTHSTFRQPLPASLAPFMSQGYPKASVEPKPYELISIPGAGSVAVSAADMAKFMIAHLNQGAGLLKPETAQLMHEPTLEIVPGTDRMALGFYELQANGLSAIAHGGDLNYFHSDMWIYPSKNVGLFISMNSAGLNGATEAIRIALFEQFADRYFPAANSAAPVELPTAKEHARMLAGSYINSRGAFTDFADVLNFIGQAKITLDADGRPAVPSILGGPPIKWIEIAPFVWQAANGHAHLGAMVENGRVVRWSMNPVSPFMVWMRAPWYRNAAWLMPAFLAALALVALTALSWPVGAISRRRFGAAMPLNGPDLKSYRWVRGFSWLVLMALGGWALLFVSLESAANLDAPLWILQIAGTAAFIGLCVTAVWNLLRVWQGNRSWFAKLWSVLLVLAALVTLWVTFGFHLISFGVRY
ncbi:MAG TPA: serine hydrolase domain-containing protein [Steroidobacteraceae bacterium]|jgi:CubicO group peptidase (beta-lactamase class C family)